MEARSSQGMVQAGGSRPRSGRISPRLRLCSPTIPVPEDLNRRLASGVDQQDTSIPVLDKRGRISVRISWAGKQPDRVVERQDPGPSDNLLAHDRQVKEQKEKGNLLRAVFVRNSPKLLTTKTLEDVSVAGFDSERSQRGSTPQLLIYTPLCAKRRIATSVDRVKPLMIRHETYENCKDQAGGSPSLPKGASQADYSPKVLRSPVKTQGSLRSNLVQNTKQKSYRNIYHLIGNCPRQPTGVWGLGFGVWGLGFG